jgi:hypothetical protein
MCGQKNLRCTAGRQRAAGRAKEKEREGGGDFNFLFGTKKLQFIPLRF